MECFVRNKRDISSIMSTGQNPEAEAATPSRSSQSEVVTSDIEIHVETDVNGDFYNNHDEYSYDDADEYV